MPKMEIRPKMSKMQIDDAIEYKKIMNAELLVCDDMPNLQDFAKKKRGPPTNRGQ